MNPEAQPIVVFFLFLVVAPLLIRWAIRWASNYTPEKKELTIRPMNKSQKARLERIEANKYLVLPHYNPSIGKFK